jgi:hypothetical protein
MSQAKTTLFAWRSYHLKQITFKTLHSAWPAKMNFAYASWAGGGASRFRRQSISSVKCSKT